MEIQEEAKDDNDVAGHEANHDNNDMDANQGIESMLELLCTFGAAHRLLCTIDAERLFKSFGCCRNRNI